MAARVLRIIACLAALAAPAVASADDGVPLLAGWGDLGEGAPCLRAVAEAAANCAGDVIAARRACDAAERAGTPCDAAGLTERLAAARAGALDAVERACGSAPSVPGSDLAALLRDAVRACRAVEAGALAGAAAARSGADAACVAAAVGAAARLAQRAAREWRRVFDHIAASPLEVERKEALVAIAAQRIRRAAAAGERLLAARCRDGAFADAYDLPAAALLAGAAESGRCFAESAYDQPAVTCAAAAEAQAAGAACVAGVAGGYPCRNVDLAAHLPFTAIGGGQGNDVWGWTDPLTGAEIALMGRTNGTAFIDVSVPTAPVYLGSLPPHSGNSTWRGIKVFADHAYIVSEAGGHGMQVFDLTQLRGLTGPPRTFTETAHYAGFSNCHTLAVNEDTGFLYAAGTNTCSGGLHIVDARTPAAPVFAGCVSGDGYTHESQCVTYHGPDADRAGRQICFSSNTDTLTVIDVSTPSAPVQLSRTPYGGRGYTHQGWLTEDHQWFLMNDETDEERFGHNTRTLIWDVRDLDQPFVASEYFGPTGATDHNLYVADGFVFESNYRAGLRILDAAAVANGVLNEVAWFDVHPASDAVGYAGTWSNYPFFASGTVLVSSIEGGLYVLRPALDDPGASPTPTPRPPTSTATPTRTVTATPTATPIPVIVLDPIAAPLPVGGAIDLSGSGFTAGSRVMLFVATAGGAVAAGPFTPAPRTATSLRLALPVTVPLGNGFASVVVVNTDQGYAQSNPQSQLLVGAPGSSVPTILAVGGVAVQPADASVPTALAPVVLAPGAALTISGRDFNVPLVNCFTATGNVGPLSPAPGGDAGTITVVVPAGAPTGPGALQVVNAPYAGAVTSNAVSVAIGARIGVESVSQAGATVTVTGSGFSSATVINLFGGTAGVGIANFGGLGAGGQPVIPLTVVSPQQFTFTRPAGLAPGPAYVHAINPPYVPFSSSGDDPDGAFTALMP